MVEVIVVLVLIAMITAVSIASYTSYQKWTVKKQNNAYAEEIFYAAQAALSNMNATGELLHFGETLLSESERGTFVSLSRPAGDTRTLYALVNPAPFQPGAGSNEAATLFRTLLEKYITSQELLSHNICIELSVDSAVVYAVWYSNGAYSTTSDFRSLLTDENRSLNSSPDQLGYFGPATGERPEQYGVVTKAALAYVNFANEEELKLVWQLGTKYLSMTEALDYKITLYTLDQSGVKSEFLTFKIGPSVGKPIYAYSDGETHRIEAEVTFAAGRGVNGTYSFRVYYDENRQVTLVLDAYDYSSVLESALPAEAEFESYVAGNAGTYSFTRFSTLPVDLAAQVEVSGSVTRKNHTLQSENQANSLFSSFSGEKGGAAVAEIESGRHLSNLRFIEHMQDYLYFTRVTYQQLASSTIDWQKDMIDGKRVYKGTYSATGENRYFVPIELLHQNSVYTSKNNRMAVVKNLRLNVKKDTTGIFRVNKGTIQYLRFSGSFETGYSEIGLLCGVNEGTVYYCTATADYSKANDFTGVLCGVNRGTVTRCTTGGMLKGRFYVGGIAGLDEYTAARTYDTCVNSADISGEAMVGGILGAVNDPVSRKEVDQANFLVRILYCRNYGAVRASSETSLFCGGIVGYNDGAAIQNCISTPAQPLDENGNPVHLTESATMEEVQKYCLGYFIGGIVGLNRSGTIDDCYTGTTDITGKTVSSVVIGNGFVGGICGLNATELASGELKGNIHNENNANVMGNQYVGGVVGANCRIDLSELYQKISRKEPVTSELIEQLAPGLGEVPYDGNIRITNWINRGIISASGRFAGGITGFNCGMIDSCISSISVSSQTDIAQKLQTAKVLGENGWYVGGIAGYNCGYIHVGEAGKSEDVVSLIAGKYFVGGIVGYNEKVPGMANVDLSGIVEDYELIGGYINGEGFVGGFMGLNTNADAYQNGTYVFHSAPNEVDGKFFVGGVFGASLIVQDDNMGITIKCSTDNPLGAVKGVGYVGGYMGYLAALKSEEALEAHREYLCSVLESQSDDLEKIRKIFTVPVSATDAPLSTVILSSKDGGQNTIGAVTGDLFVAGILGGADLNCRLLIRDVVNNTAITSYRTVKPGDTLNQMIQNALKGGAENHETDTDFALCGGILGFVSEYITVDNCSNTDIGIITTNGTYTASIAEISFGVIQNCKAGIIVGTNDIGGIVGINCGKVENCSLTGTIYGNNNLGGIVAHNYGDVKNCTAGSLTGGGVAIQASGKYIGGIVAVNYCGRVENCSLKGSIEGNGIFVGGAVGRYSKGDIVEFSLENAVIGGMRCIGGLIGVTEQNLNGATISSAANSQVLADSGEAGGILGATTKADFTVKNCENRLEVRATTGHAGGILPVAGRYYTDCDSLTEVEDGTFTVSGCANYGSVSVDYASGGIPSYVGGICGAVLKNNTVDGCTVGGCTITGIEYAGGIAAVNFGTVKDSNVTAGDTKVWGIIGSTIVGYKNIDKEETVSVPDVKLTYRDDTEREITTGDVTLRSDPKQVTKGQTYNYTYDYQYQGTWYTNRTVSFVAPYTGTVEMTGYDYKAKTFSFKYTSVLTLFSGQKLYYSSWNGQQQQVTNDITNLSGNEVTVKTDASSYTITYEYGNGWYRTRTSTLTLSAPSADAKVIVSGFSRSGNGSNTTFNFTFAVSFDVTLSKPLTYETSKQLPVAGDLTNLKTPTLPATIDADHKTVTVPISYTYQGVTYTKDLSVSVPHAGTLEYDKYTYSTNGYTFYFINRYTESIPIYEDVYGWINTGVGNPAVVEVKTPGSLSNAVYLGGAVGYNLPGAVIRNVSIGAGATNPARVTYTGNTAASLYLGGVSGYNAQDALIAGTGTVNGQGAVLTSGTKVYVSLTVASSAASSSSGYMGGIVGLNLNTVTGYDFYGTVTGVAGMGGKESGVGGIAGANGEENLLHASISACTASGEILNRGTSKDCNVGGIVGINRGCNHTTDNPLCKGEGSTVFGCSIGVYGNISVIGTVGSIGGYIGTCEGKISFCGQTSCGGNSVAVKSDSGNPGAVVSLGGGVGILTAYGIATDLKTGYTGSNSRNANWKVQTYGTSHYEYRGIGGVIGTSNSQQNIYRLENYGDVDGYRATYGTGGVIGFITLDYDASYIEGCRNYGTVYNGHYANGGIVGYIRICGAYLVNCSNYGIINNSNNWIDGSILGHAWAGFGSANIFFFGCSNYSSSGVTQIHGKVAGGAAVGDNGYYGNASDPMLIDSSNGRFQLIRYNGSAYYLCVYDVACKDDAAVYALTDAKLEREYVLSPNMRAAQFRFNPKWSNNQEYTVVLYANSSKTNVLAWSSQKSTPALPTPDVGIHILPDGSKVVSLDNPEDYASLGLKMDGTDFRIVADFAGTTYTLPTAGGQFETTFTGSLSDGGFYVFQVYAEASADSGYTNSASSYEYRRYFSDHTAANIRPSNTATEISGTTIESLNVTLHPKASGSTDETSNSRVDLVGIYNGVTRIIASQTVVLPPYSAETRASLSFDSLTVEKLQEFLSSGGTLELRYYAWEHYFVKYYEILGTLPADATPPENWNTYDLNEDGTVTYYRSTAIAAGNHGSENLKGKFAYGGNGGTINFMPLPQNLNFRVVGSNAVFSFSNASQSNRYILFAEGLNAGGNWETIGTYYSATDTGFVFSGSNVAFTIDGSRLNYSKVRFTVTAESSADNMIETSAVSAEFDTLLRLETPARPSAKLDSKENMNYIVSWIGLTDETNVQEYVIVFSDGTTTLTFSGFTPKGNGSVYREKIDLSALTPGNQVSLYLSAMPKDPAAYSSSVSNVFLFTLPARMAKPLVGAGTSGNTTVTMTPGKDNKLTESEFTQEGFTFKVEYAPRNGTGDPAASESGSYLLRFFISETPLTDAELALFDFASLASNSMSSGGTLAGATLQVTGIGIENAARYVYLQICCQSNNKVTSEWSDPVGFQLPIVVLEAPFLVEDTESTGGVTVTVDRYDNYGSYLDSYQETNLTILQKSLFWRDISGEDEYKLQITYGGKTVTVAIRNLPTVEAGVCPVAIDGCTATPLTNDAGEVIGYSIELKDEGGNPISADFLYEEEVTDWQGNPILTLHYRVTTTARLIVSVDKQGAPTVFELVLPDISDFPFFSGMDDAVLTYFRQRQTKEVMITAAPDALHEDNYDASSPCTWMQYEDGYGVVITSLNTPDVTQGVSDDYSSLSVPGLNNGFAVLKFGQVSDATYYEIAYQYLSDGELVTVYIKIDPSVQGNERCGITVGLYHNPDSNNVESTAIQSGTEWFYVYEIQSISQNGAKVFLIVRTDSENNILDFILVTGYQGAPTGGETILIHAVSDVEGHLAQSPDYIWKGNGT